MGEKLASRLGFILLSAGCAIGIGNVWRFPYVVGQSGGGWFVLIYLVFLLLLGIPVLTMEFATGRAAQRSIAKIYEELTPRRRIWALHGVAGLIGTMAIMMFYTTVSGWMLLYFLKTASGEFEGLGPSAISRVFDAMLSNPWQQTWAMAAVSIGGAAICAVGVQRGLERVTKWMMLALLVLIVVLAANSALLDGAGKGLEFYLLPDFARMRSVGLSTVVVNAMNQAFYTLSLGIGAMSIFGSYIGKRRSLLGEAVNVAVLDTVVALSAGVIIIPACFAYGIEAGQGQGLIFVTLPNVFNHMSCGRLWGAIFFLFMCFAAFSTVLALFENLIAIVRDYSGWGRGCVCAIVGAAVLVLSMPCVLGFNLWSSFCPLGEGSCILDLEDFVVSSILLPLGSLAFAVYCTHRFGWGWHGFVAEANAGKGLRMPAWLRWYCGYVLPAAIVFIFVIGLVRQFA